MRLPKLLYHRSSSRFYFNHGAERHYVGAGEDPALPPLAVRRKYSEALARIARGQPPFANPLAAAEAPLVLSVAELADQFLRWAESRYTQSDQPKVILWAMRPLVKGFGRLPASEFGPRRLQEHQEGLATHGLTRQGINIATTHIRALFAWAVANELLKPEQLVALRAVRGLRRGAIQAREAPPRWAVPVEVVQATLQFLSPTIAAMVKLQLLSGMRPAEVCALSMVEIEREGPALWVYRPAAHKMAHLGRERAIPLMAEAIATLLPFQRADGKPLFSPADTREAWEAGRRAKRLAKQPRIQPSQLDRHKPDPQVVPGEQYDTASYRRAIKRACERVRQYQRENGMAPDHPDWSPNALRKRAAQLVADAVGIDKAQALLGHKDKAITQRHYAKEDFEAAKLGAAALGNRHLFA